MSGPVASVLFTPTGKSVRGLVGRAREACGDTSGTDQEFWLEGRPFLSTAGPEYPEQRTEIVESGLPRLLGWMPEEVVRFCAMCNGAEDHRLLGRLCLALCEETGGLVDFAGLLSIGPDLGGSAPAPAARLVNPMGLEGILFATTHAMVWGDFGTHHYGDANLLRAWLEHPDFRMNK